MSPPIRPNSANFRGRRGWNEYLAKYAIPERVQCVQGQFSIISRTRGKMHHRPLSEFRVGANRIHPRRMCAATQSPLKLIRAVAWEIFQNGGILPRLGVALSAFFSHLLQAAIRHGA